MKKQKKPLSNKKERVLISDILPYELPATFSNRHFYEFLIENQIEIDNDKIQWRADDPILQEIIKLLFGFHKDKPIIDRSIKINIKKGQMKTIPFTFKIPHKENDFRELTIIHPKNQLALIDFYEKYKELILYYCNISPFSIRKPYKIAKVTYRQDRTHFELLAYDHEHKTAEEFDKEYKNLKTFFTYKKYSNVYKFYESYDYHRCEKKYNKLFKFDIARCFDSIYSHSISWSLLNKDIVKDNIGESNGTFGGKFDTLMQCLNYGETKGIIIGPEFSRIFAELILQQIDVSVLRLLEKQKPRLIHKKDYSIFRYVDDFFVFYNDDKTKEDILKTYRLQLNKYKLYLNDSKSVMLEKPIITGLTIAKQKISDLFNMNLAFKIMDKNEDRVKEEETSDKKYSFYVSSNKLITKFKTIIKETDVAYKDILNYTLACIDRKILKLIKICSKLEDSKSKETKITKAFLEILDFTFFLYSVSPRVNTSIKLCMILSKTIKFSKIKDNLNYDNKHLILKKIFDEISLALSISKNSEHAQVETLYLLIALKKLGREYRIDETLLCSYFGIYPKENKCRNNLNYLPIVVLLFYIENKVRYNGLKGFLKIYIKKKFEKTKKINRGMTTELTLLLFDLLSCPFLNNSYKKELLSYYEIDNILKTDIINKREYWFTKWTDFELGKELDAKRSQEVY